MMEPGRHLIPSLSLRVLTRRALADARVRPRLDTFRCFPYDHVRHRSLNRQTLPSEDQSDVTLETEAYASNENITHDVALPGGLLVIDDSVRDERRGATPPPPAQPAGRKSESRQTHRHWNCGGRRSGRSN